LEDIKYFQISLFNHSELMKKFRKNMIPDIDQVVYTLMDLGMYELTSRQAVELLLNEKNLNSDIWRYEQSIKIHGLELRMEKMIWK